MDVNFSNMFLPYHITHTNTLINAINKHNIILDASDTGTGKTYCAMALCAQKNLDAFVICPKSVISNWFSIAKLFNVNIIVSNYERVKSGKVFDEKKVIINFCKVNYFLYFFCYYINYINYLII